MATEYIVPDTYATIAAGLTQAEADGLGDVRKVRIKDGTYSENLVMDNINWTQHEFLIVEAFTAGSTAVIIDGSGGSNTINLNSRKYVQLRDLNVKDAVNIQIRDFGESCVVDTVETSGGQRGLYLVRKSRIVDCNIHDHSIQGIYILTTSYDNLLERTKVHDCPSEAIALDNRGALFARSCWFYANGGNGAIEVLATTDAGTFIDLRQCSFLGNSGADVYSIAADVKIVLVNNIFRSSGTYAIDVPNTFDPLTPSPIIYSEGNCYSNQGTAIARIGATTYSTLAAWQAYTEADAVSVTTDPLYISETAGSEDLLIQAGSPRINAGVGSGVWKDISGTAFIDPHHPAGGSDGSRDIELDNGAPLPSGQPSFGTITLDQNTGALTAAWTPSDVGNHGFLYRRKLAETVWTLGATSSTTSFTDTLPDIGEIYELIIFEEKDDVGSPSGFPGRPSSVPQRLAFIGDAAPLSELESVILTILQNDAQLETYAPAGQWTNRVFRDIDESRLPPRNGSALPYVEFDVSAAANLPDTSESADEETIVRFRFVLAGEGTTADRYAIVRDTGAALRAGLGVPEQNLRWTQTVEDRRGRFHVVEYEAAMTLLTGAVSMD